MSELTIRLPDTLREFVESQAAGQGFPSASEYIAHLVDDAQRRAAIDRLQDKLIEGLESGPGREVNDEFWKERREVLERRLAEERRR